MKNRTSCFGFVQSHIIKNVTSSFTSCKMWIFSRGSYKSMMAQWWPNDSTSKAFAAIWSVLKRCAWLPRALAASCSGLNLTFSESGDVWGFFWFWWMFWWFLVICWWFWWFVDDFLCFFNDVWCFLMILGDCLMISTTFAMPVIGDSGYHNRASPGSENYAETTHRCIGANKLQVRTG